MVCPPVCGDNQWDINARVMVLVHDTSSECTLQMYDFFLKKCLTSAIVFVVRFCVIVVINKHNTLKQKRSQNDVRLRGFGSS